MAAYYRIYYDLTFGEPLATTWARGNVQAPERAEDFARLPGLAGRTEADAGCWEQLTEDAELEALLRSKKPKMDVSQTPPALTWVDWPIPEPSDEDEISADEALAIMMGGEGA